jgi:hypothetical protein
MHPQKGGIHGVFILDAEKTQIAKSCTNLLNFLQNCGIIIKTFFRNKGKTFQKGN